MAIQAPRGLWDISLQNRYWEPAAVFSLVGRFGVPCCRAWWFSEFWQGVGTQRGRESPAKHAAYRQEKELSFPTTQLLNTKYVNNMLLKPHTRQHTRQHTPEQGQYWARALFREGLSERDWWRLADRRLGRSPSVPRCGRASHHPSPLYTSTCHWAGNKSSENDQRRGRRGWVQRRREGVSVKLLLCCCSRLLLLLSLYMSRMCKPAAGKKGAVSGRTWFESILRGRPPRAVSSLYQHFLLISLFDQI